MDGRARVRKGVLDWCETCIVPRAGWHRGTEAVLSSGHILPAFLQRLSSGRSRVPGEEREKKKVMKENVKEDGELKRERREEGGSGRSFRLFLPPPSPSPPRLRSQNAV